MNLDELYGDGSRDAFVEALPGKPKVEEVSISEDAVRVNVTWRTPAKLKVEVHLDDWLFLYLWTANPRNGLYTGIVDGLSAVARDHFGVKRWRAQAADEEHAQILMSRGGWERTGMDLAWELGED